MLPVAVCLVALSVLVAAERAGWRGVRVVAKLTASSAFVWAALAWGAATTPHGQLLLLGLCLCWIGDALLLPTGRSVWLQLGIAAFLLAHVAYALAFARLSPDPIALLAAAVFAAPAAGWVLRWLLPYLQGRLRGLVCGYVAAISVMLVMAAAAVAGGAPVLVGVGALGFALSDVSVARDRFVSGGFADVAWGLPAYFVSQLVLAYSVTQLLAARGAQGGPL